MNAEILTTKDLAKVDPVFGQISFDNHEQIVFCNDKDTGLKAIIGVHNTVLGPALGGTRMWQYTSEWEALNDVLRLSRGMTFKSAISGLNLGGGKAVIIGNSKTDKSPELIQKFGSFVEGLSGKYITAEDVGTTTADMDLIHDVTKHVTGISESRGGSGNPSPITAYGVYMGIKAAAKQQFGTDKLSGLKVLVQGIGNVGETVVSYLVKEDAVVYITDIFQERVEEIAKKYNVHILEGEVYDAAVDIYSPCALGATVNDDCLSRLKAKVIAGAANNQLANEVVHGQLLKEKGILYAPDFLINAGGIISVYGEIAGYGLDEAMKRTENIYNTTLEIFDLALKQNCTTHQAALQLAQQRIDERKKQQSK
ncbi:MAG: Glu/Leu/Phe/Val dehydrogenase [Flavobacterium sp.]|nr:Glu/Leu/Phe/Val dehydrogenase [Candidatus Neoflavobacterium equi]